MAQVILRINGYVCPLPGDKDGFVWDVRSDSPEGALLSFAERICPHLNNMVPFVVEGQSLVALMRIEVLVCD